MSTGDVVRDHLEWRLLDMSDVTRLVFLLWSDRVGGEFSSNLFSRAIKTKRLAVGRLAEKNGPVALIGRKHSMCDAIGQVCG